MPNPLPPCLLLILLGILSAADRTITVDGTAMLQVAPEQAIITFGIETVDASLAQARQANQETMLRLLRTLSELTPKVALQQSPPSMGEDRDGRRHVGHIAHATITVTTEPQRLAEIIATGMGAGATHVLDSVYAVRDARPYRDQARVLACRAAREKAELLAHEMGVAVGEVHAISEPHYWWQGQWRSRWWCNGLWSSGWFGGNRNAVQNTISVSGPDDGGTTERQEITAQIQVVFSIR